MASLGAAVLELRTDLRPMAAGLKAGERELGVSLKRQEVMVAEHTSRVGRMMSASAASSRSLALGHGDNTAALSRSTEAMRAETVAAGGLAGAHRSVAREAAGEAESHARLAPRVASTAGAHRALKNDVEQAGYAFSGFAGRAGAAGRSLDLAARHAQIFKSAGLDYIAAGLVASGVAVVGYGTKVNVTFDSIGKSIQRQAGTSRQATGQLLDDVKAVGSQAPESWRSIGDAVAAQYRLFGSSNAEIKRNTDLFLAFAESAHMDVVPAITAVSNVFRLFRPPGMSAVDVMDQLVNLAQRTQRPLGDLLGIINKYGPQFQAMGLSFTQTVGLMQAFSAAGINATAMGRGLSAAVSRAAQEQKKGAAASADGGAKMLTYRDAVQSAQMRVDELSKKLASGKGDQSKLNGELGIARDRLTVAKDKLDQYTKSTQAAGGAHKSISQIIAAEAASIEGARSKQEALNLAIQAFGPRLGPQMADALYKNKAGLDAMDRSLGDAHGKTEGLARAQRDTLHGQLEILHHDFDVLASKVGLSADGLKSMVGSIADVVKAISSLPKPVLDFLVYGAAGGGAAMLLARHTPLGGLASRGLGLAPGGALSTALVGKSATGEAIARGPQTVAEERVGASQVTEMTVGTLIARSMIGGPGGMGKGGGGAPIKGAENAAKAGETEAAAAEGGIMSRVRALGPKLSSVLGGVMRVGMVSAIGAAVSQGVGALVGGKAGKTVAGVGSWASVGGAIGFEVGGPAGAALGAGLAGGVKLAITLIHKANYGRDVADAVFKNFGGRSVAPALARHMEDELNKANSIVQRHTRAGMGFQIHTQMDPAQQAELNAHARKAGSDAVRQLEAGWSQYRFQDPQAMWRQFIDVTKKFPRGQVGGQMKAEAAFEMLMYTRELENKGRLPAGAYKQMLDRVNRQFPWWHNELRKAAIDGANAFARNLNLRGAENSVKQSLMRMRGDFPQLVHTMDTTRGDMVTKAAAISRALQGIERQGGPAARQAAADLKGLRISASRDLGQLQQQVQHNVDGMKAALIHGSMDARTAAVNNVKAMQTDIDRSFQSQLINAQTYIAHTKQNFQTGWEAVRTQTLGSLRQQETDLQASYARQGQSKQAANAAVAALDAQKNQAQLTSLQAYTNNMLTAMENTGHFNYQGMVAIVQQYNQAAKPLGGATIPVPTKVQIGGGIGNLGAGVAGALQGHAEGGIVQLGRPGEAGRDSIPLTVGGRDFVAARGEQVVVFNRHQIPDVNRRFSDTGGLPGYFAKNRTPNYMAGGGIVTASTFGGPGDPGTGSHGYRGDDLNAKPDSFAELNMGTALGNLPYGAPITVTFGGRTERVYKRDIGLGGPGLGGHVRAVDLWYAAANAIGLSGLADVMVNGGEGVNVQISGGGGGGVGALVAMLTSPHAEGSGPITDIVNKSFKKATDAANQKLQSLAPAGGGFAGGQGTAPPLSGPAAVQAMIRAADWITAQHYPYLWGGGHGSFNGPYDCSGAVSAVLHAAGMLSSPEVSGDLGSSYGEAGPGKFVTIYGNPEHVWMTIMGHAFGTSGSNPGGGAGWFGGMSTAGFGVRHPAGLASGGVVDLDTMLKSAPPDKRKRAKLALSRDIHSVLPGMAGGGIPAPGTSYVQASGKPLTRGQEDFIRHFEKQPKNKGHRIPASALKRHGLKVGKKPPVNQDLVGTFPNSGLKGYGGTNPFNIGKDMRAINSALDLIFGLVGGGQGGTLGGGGADKMSKLIQEKTDLYSSGLYPSPNFGDWASPANFVISQDPTTGQAVAPYISPNIDTVGHQLEEVLDYQNKWVADLQGGLSASSALKPSVHNAIAYREKQIAAIKRKVQANIKRINQLKEDLKRRQARMKELQALIKDRQSKIRAERRKRTPDHAKLAQWGQEVASYSQELHVLSQGDKPVKDEIAKLEAENMGFVGGKDAIPSTPGGEAGEIQAQLGAPAGGTAVEHLIGGGSSASGLYQVQDAVQSWTDQIGGPDGDLFQQTLQARLYAKGLADLAPGASTALGVARAGATSAHDQELIAQLQQKLQETSQELGIATAQERIFAGAGDLGLAVRELPQWGGSFMREGTIPGPLGAPRLIEGHGGEEISWPGGDDDRFEVHHHYAPGMEFLKDLITTEVRKGGKTIRPTPALPSAGGGVLS